MTVEQKIMSAITRADMLIVTYYPLVLFVFVFVVSLLCAMVIVKAADKRLK